VSMVRRYVFAFVAVCLAFAGGVALGNGPLQGTTAAINDGASVAHANSRLSEQIAALRQDQAFSQALGKAAAPALLAGTLKDTSVAIFVLPGVAKTTVAGVSRAVAAAGGETVITGHLRPTLVDPGKKTYVDSVATNSLRGLKDLGSSATLPTYGRIGILLARAYTGSENRLSVDDEATHIDAQLQGAKLVSLHDPLHRRASAVIVLAAGGHGGGNAVYAVHQIESQVVDGLATDCDGLLLGAPASASAPGGLIDAVTTSPDMTNAIATLNVVDTPAGQTAAVASLVAALDGQPGTFGMKNGVPALPPPLAAAG
jgi:Copper transport outer membrane protein, MctB